MMRKVWLWDFFACPRSQLLHDSAWIWTQAFPELILFRDWAKRIEKSQRDGYQAAIFGEKKKSIQIQSDDVPIYCHSELTSVHGLVIMSNSQPWRVSPKESPSPPLCHYPFPTGLDLPIHSILICFLFLCLLWSFLFSFSSLFSTSHVWSYQHFLTFSYMFSNAIVFCVEARSSFNSGLALGIPCIYITFYGSQRF